MALGAARSFGPLEFLAQGLDGDTHMGLVPGGRNAVIAHFQAAYLLASWTAGESARHRLSGRYDVFRVRDRDDFAREDANDESGSAWTVAYSFRPGARHRIWRASSAGGWACPSSSSSSTPPASSPTG